MPWNVEGRVGVVVGASCALGKEVARRLALEHRMKLACVSRKPFAFALPEQCKAFQANVCSGGDCDALFKSISTELGPVSLVVNCAGVTLSKVHLRCTDQDYDFVMNTNLRGALNVTKSALRHGGLLKLQDGSVVHIGSVVGVTGNEGQVIYSASKAALSGAVKSWAKEYGVRNTRFNVVAPGLIDGEGMGAELSPEQRELWKKACPLGRLAKVDEVADVVVTVALSPYINGQTISVDGGLSC